MRYLKRFLLLVVIVGAALKSTVIKAQQSQNIDKNWQFLKSDLGGVWEAVRPVGRGNPESVPIWMTVDLPHCYNAEDAVDPNINYYQGPAWYRKNISVTNPYQNGRTLLVFEGVGQKADVYINTTKVGSHIGGYDEWTVDITDAVAQFKQTTDFKKRFKESIPISIRVDNSRDLEMIPSDMSDFNVYGGIYRHVHLRYIAPIALDKVFATTTVDKKGNLGLVEIKLRPLTSIQERSTITTSLLDPQGKEIAQRRSVVDSIPSNMKLSTLQLKKPKLWSPDTPTLYTLVTTVRSTSGEYQEKTKIGFRHFEFIEQGAFQLNGQRLLLRGTHRHEDHAGTGAAMSDELIQEEMQLMKDMGVNFIRLGHYQQSRRVLELCDSLGILVWEEIPWCRGGLGGQHYQEQARRMLTNMIEQHYNHPSIIIWGLGNENDWPGDFSSFDKEAIRRFMSELNELSHHLDPLRKTAIRRCDFCKDIVDIYSPSIWAGWYRGVYADYKRSSQEEMKKVKHFLHAEWGGDSHARRHAESPDQKLIDIQGGQGTDERAGDASLYGGAARVSKDGDWSESYICNLIDWHLKEQENMPWLTGSAYWPFKDFSTPVRPDNPIPYMNQKGVVERDLTKKESYYVFQSYWAEHPMLHIYGHSWPVRWGEKEEKKMIKVYANVEAVELFVNGISQGIKRRNSQDFPAAGLRWLVNYKEGENHIRAVSRDKNKEITDDIIQHYQTAKWTAPKQLKLQVIHRDTDVVTVEATVHDENGILCLDAQDWVYFGAAGDTKLIANQGTSQGSSKVQLYNGRARIRIHMTGETGIATVKSDKIATELIQL